MDERGVITDQGSPLRAASGGNPPSAVGAAPPARPADKRWLDQLAVSRVLFFGDHHPDEHTKHAALSLLSRLALLSHRPVVGLELVESRHQAALDDYLHGDLGDAGLCAKIGYQDWGFDWRLYRGFFHLARFAGLPLLALDDRSLLGVQARDGHATEVLRESLMRRPDQLHFVLFGEDHLSDGGLPDLVRVRGDLSPEQAPVVCLGTPSGGWGVHGVAPGRWRWAVSAAGLRNWRAGRSRGTQPAAGPDCMGDLLQALGGQFQLPLPDLSAYHGFPQAKSFVPFLARRGVDPGGPLTALQRLGCAVMEEPACWVLGDPTRPDLLAGAALWLLSDAPRAEHLDGSGCGPDWARVSALVEMGRRIWLPMGSSRQAESLREALWCGRPYPLTPTASIRRGDRLARRLQDRALRGQPFQDAVRRLAGHC